jgi:hypothetical protein
VVWIGLVWLRIGRNVRVVVNAVVNLRDPENIWKLLSSYTTSGFSDSAQPHRISSGVEFLVSAVSQSNSCGYP